MHIFNVDFLRSLLHDAVSVVAGFYVVAGHYRHPEGKVRPVRLIRCGHWSREVSARLQ